MIEDFRTFTEVDSGGDITVAAAIITWAGMRRDAASWVVKDYKAGFFGDFEIDITLDFSAIDAGDVSNRDFVEILTLSNTAGSFADIIGGDFIVILCRQNGGNDNQFQFVTRQFTGGVEDFTNADASIRGLDPYYLTLKRVAGTVTLLVYSDASRLVLIDTIQNGGADQTAYRYLIAMGSYDSGNDPADNSDGTVSDCEVIVPDTSGVENLACGFNIGGPDWLPGWAKRVKLTIDQSDITAALVNFPVLVYLSGSSGRNGEDVTFVFDEVGANSLKIAITEGDGVTECYVEVEEWDNGAEEAWLWVKVPSIASGADTEIYLYYDNGHVNNTDHVGECADGSAATEAVWSNGFIAVYHMKDNTTSTILDSTSSDFDGVKTAANNPFETTGKIGPAQEFVPDETITLGAFGGPYTAMTVESWFQADDTDAVRTIIAITEVGGQIDRVIQDINSDLLANYWRTDGVTVNPKIAWSDEVNWHYFATTRSGTAIKGYPDGALDAGLNGVVGAGTITNLTDCQIGSLKDSDNFFDGTVDEVRFSNVERNAAWLEASYESGRDDLLDFGGEEFADSEDLACGFNIPGESEDLLAEFVVRTATEDDLSAEFEVGQGSVELGASFDGQVVQSLLGKFDVRGIESEELLGEFVSRQSTSQDLAASFDGQVSLNLPAEFISRPAGSADLPGEFIVRQIDSQDLLGELSIRRSALQELSAGFVVRRSNSQELAAEFISRQAGSEDLLGKVIIRHSSLQELAASLTIRRTATPLEIKGGFKVAVYSVDLLGNIYVRPTTSRATDFVVKDNTRGLTVRDVDRTMTVTRGRRMRVK